MEANVLNLPPEIIVNILKYFSFPEIENIRPTCRAFNAAGLHLQNLGLRKLRLKTKLILNNYVHTKWFNLNERQKPICLPEYHKHMNRGVSSILILTGLVQIADASTYYFIGKGIIPPFSGALLEDIDKALTLATKHNLVGKERLRKLSRAITQYFKSNFIDLCSHLQQNKMLFFKTIIDLIDCLPVCKESIQETDYGLYVHSYLPDITISFLFDYAPNIYLDEEHLLHVLIRLSLHAIRKFIYTDQSDFIPDLELQNRTVSFTEIELHIACSSEEKTGVVCIRDMLEKETCTFQLKLAGTSLLQTDNSSGALVVPPISFIYKSFTDHLSTNLL